MPEYFDDTYEIDHQLHKYERVEEEVERVFQKSNQLFDSLFGAWQKDPGMQHFLMDQQDTFDHGKRHIRHEMDDQKEALLKERRLREMDDISYDTQAKGGYWE